MLLTNGAIGISGYIACWLSICEYITYRLHGFNAVSISASRSRRVRLCCTWELHCLWQLF